MHFPRIRCALLGAVLVVWAASGWAQSTPVRVLTGTWSSAPAPLQAQLFLPNGSGPHPAVVMVHGCGGAYAKDGSLNARHRMWGEFLASQGYVALMLDSFTARGIRELCTIRHSARTLKEADRVGDAYAALVYLRQRGDVDAARIALLGWSHGGGVVLDAIGHPPETTQSGFRAAVSFYPGCSARNQHADRFHPSAPLLVLMGEADDWTPVAPCQALAATVAARGEPMAIVTYPETFHDFDNPALKGPHKRTDIPNGVQPGAGVTVAPNTEAREDAKRRVAAFLASHLQ